jgi:hypothetical protein
MVDEYGISWSDDWQGYTEDRSLTKCYFYTTSA